MSMPDPTDEYRWRMSRQIQRFDIEASSPVVVSVLVARRNVNRVDQGG